MWLIEAEPGRLSVEVMLKTISLTNFRGFASLELKELQRVNLIVGRNNCGKTSLLEAIHLLCQPNDCPALPTRFRLRSGDPGNRYFRWLLRDCDSVDSGAVRGATDKSRLEIGFAPTGKPRPPGHGPMQPTQSLNNAGLNVWSQSTTHAMTSRVLSFEQRRPEDLVPLVGQALRVKDGEETLQQLLKQVDPRIRKIRIDPGLPGQGGNQVVVDLGLSELVPLTQAGQGIYRLVTIFGEIISQPPTVMLVDEVENGLHHSVLETFWAGIAELAGTLGVQVFATTHSHECLEAAHAAFSKRKNYDFAVIQLFRQDNGAGGRVLDRSMIEAGIEGNIDLR